MNIPPGAPSWLVLAVVLITTLGTVGTGFLTLRQGSTLKRVDEQVSNTHETNLRDDIDRMHSAVIDLSTKMDDIDRRTRILEDSGIRGMIKRIL